MSKALTILHCVISGGVWMQHHSRPYCYKLVVFQFDDIAHSNIHPLFFLQSVKVKENEIKTKSGMIHHAQIIELTDRSLNGCWAKWLTSLGWGPEIDGCLLGCRFCGETAGEKNSQWPFWGSEPSACHWLLGCVQHSRDWKNSRRLTWGRWHCTHIVICGILHCSDAQHQS